MVGIVGFIVLVASLSAGDEPSGTATPATTTTAALSDEDRFIANASASVPALADISRTEAVNIAVGACAIAAVARDDTEYAELILDTWDTQLSPSTRSLTFDNDPRLLAVVAVEGARVYCPDELQRLGLDN